MPHCPAALLIKPNQLHSALAGRAFAYALCTTHTFLCVHVFSCIVPGVCLLLQIDHHKRVTCLVCNSTVVPYEAYHIDAVRKVSGNAQQ